MASPRVEKLVNLLTLSEKISMLSAHNFWETMPIPRLGIPSLKTSDGPNGARGGTFFTDGITAACFPASVAIAAGWDNGVAIEIGKALGGEAKSKGASVLLGPTVCPHRSPLGGRNFESFSEDPLLAGRLAASYINGLQSTGVGATIKHFACNEQETRRFTINCIVSDRALREIYLKPFEIAIKTAKPWALMTSYNLVNGIHTDYNHYLLQTILREEWKWEGLVMSDWGGTNSIAESITEGLDLEMPGPPVKRKTDDVLKELELGNLKVDAINKSVTALLTLLDITKKFENDSIHPERAIDLPEDRALIRKAGASGIVLLKNSGILPLVKDKLRSIAVLGLAKECLAHGGGSASVNCHYKVTPWMALESLLGHEVTLNYAKGAQVFRNIPDWIAGLKDLNGLPGLTVSGFSSQNSSDLPLEIFSRSSGTYIAIGKCFRSVKIEGTFEPIKSGSHYLSFGSLGPSRLFIDDELTLETTVACPDSMGFLHGGADEETCQYSFHAGNIYKIRIESAAPTYDDPNVGDLMKGLLGTRLGFMDQNEYEEDLLIDAVSAAERSDIAIIFVGNTNSWETEGKDMATMNLPAYGSQDTLIEAVCKVNKNVVVVNSTGVPISMPWLPRVSALLQAWYGGQEAGNSMVDILFGLENPSGKLPVTFPKSVQESPTYNNFPGDLVTMQVNYQEDVFVGYRYYDKYPEKVQFPFGFGLSYTTFEIGTVEMRGRTLTKEDNIILSIEVKNIGRLKGSEVLQAYVAAPETSVDVPIKQLAGFRKVQLEAGETKTIEIELEYSSASYWSEAQRAWVVEEGEYKIMLGNSSQNISVELVFKVEMGFTFEP